MVSYSKFYSGSDYGFTPKIDEFQGMAYRTPVADMGMSTNPQTANQIKEVTQKLNAGIKTIEVSFLSTEVTESIPNQHIDEIRRLKELVGADLTLHGPIVEPVGLSREDGSWSEEKRLHAQRQMWSAVERGQRLFSEKDKKPIVVTFHSSAGLQEPETIELVEGKDKEGNKIKEKKVISVAVVNEETGQIAKLKLEKDWLENKEGNALNRLNEYNKSGWEAKLSQISFRADQGIDAIEKASRMGLQTREGLDETELKKLFKESKTPDGQKFVNELKEKIPGSEKIVDNMLNTMNYGEINIKEAYNGLKGQFNQAWASVQKDIARAKNDDEKKKALEQEKKLRAYSQDIQKNLENFKDPGKIDLLAQEVQKGVNLLNTITPPQEYRPLKDFAMDKAGETFANVAIDAYKKFKDNAPIIAIENPPAGMGISRAEDLKELIETSRKKFTEVAQKKLGLSEEEAKKKAAQMIGATWDVGHINMLRKFGYDTKDIVKQTETIAPFVKKVHLSDNFGLDHTELPMGMGNVPTKEHMDLINQYKSKANNIKNIIEAGNWWQHFQTNPFVESLAAFGSPLYATNTGPNAYWNTSSGIYGGYFSGRGMNPDIHHSLYGAGFANLPPELGGQMAGKSRVSGTPIE